MKLASHYNKASIIVSILVLFISGVIYYAVINHIARQELDDDLSEEIGEFVEYVNIHQALPTVSYDQNQTTFKETTLNNYNARFFDAPYNNPKTKVSEGGRAIATLVKVKDKNYIVTITESREEIEHLTTIISGITILLTAILLFILIITNTYVLNGLWRPFYHLLGEVRKFNVTDNAKIATMEGKVDEFKELGDAITKMSTRVTNDYQGLKAFTENASHEMMTPLAVITSKLDILIQDETLRDDQLNEITEIYTASNKLARLNQALLLLVKIDNNLLPDTEILDISVIVFEKARQFQELIQNKKITISINVVELKINSSKYLIDVLMNNLFSNAIRHNKAHGEIHITISGSKLLFQNSGEEPQLVKDLVFERFYKGKNSEGTGLGLAIMKNICKLYHYGLEYRFIDNKHSFEINFNC
jgi:signal transduction histidine kinase